MKLHERYRDRGGQKLLAEDAGVDPGNLSRMLRGTGGSEVAASTIVHLAAALDVTAGWLVNGEGGTEPVRAEPAPSSSLAPRSA